MRLQLVGEEIVSLTLIDQQVGQPRAAFNERTGIIFRPGVTILPEISAQRLMPPRHLRRGNNRRKSRGRTKAPGIAQRNRQRAVPAHRMAHDSLRLHVGGKMVGHQCGQFALDIAAHPVMLSEGGLGCIDIEACAQTEIIGAFGIVGHTIAAR